MGLAETIVRAILRYRHWRLTHLKGPRGRFNGAGGTRLLWENLPLSSADTVIDGGRYAGGSTSQVIVRYGARAVVHEPIPTFAANLRRLFGGNERVRVVEAGLGAQDRDTQMRVAGDGSEDFGRRENHEVVSVRIEHAAKIFQADSLKDLGCLKPKVEGAEYGVLERLLETRAIARVRSSLFQFHRNVPDPERLRQKIRERLSETHREIWS